MATNLKTVLCKYFLHGVCNRGDRCLYAHDLSARAPTTCVYYQNGNCAYGDRCRYDHIRPTTSTDASSSRSITAPEHLNYTNNHPVNQAPGTSRQANQYPTGYVEPTGSRCQPYPDIIPPRVCAPNYYDTYAYGLSYDYYGNVVPCRQMPYYTVSETDHEADGYYMNMPAASSSSENPEPEKKSYHGYEVSRDVEPEKPDGYYMNMPAGSSSSENPEPEEESHRGYEVSRDVEPEKPEPDVTGEDEILTQEPTASPKKTFSEALVSGTENNVSAENPAKLEATNSVMYVCNAKGEWFGRCEDCGYVALSTTDPEQRERHKENCINILEGRRVRAIKDQASKDRVCSICMEVVWQKMPAGRRRFGILSACNHIFCLACIRQWRAEDGYENSVIRSCPECRVQSNFVIPSTYWIETEEGKEKLISDYKEVLGEKPCRYFRDTNGTCPFGDSCFYLHDVEILINHPQNKSVMSSMSKIANPRLSDFLAMTDEYLADQMRECLRVEQFYQ